MAGWQEELAELLRELGVMQEEPQTNLRFRGGPMRSDARWRLRPGKSVERLADAFFSDDADGDDSEALPMDLDAMRHEVDSIVRQVIQLTRKGDLDRAAKDDILEVLRVLRKFAAATQQATPGDGAYLETVSAMLRFCRLVLRFSGTAIEDF